LVNSNLPQILAYLLLEKFKTGKSKIVELVEALIKNNPLNYNQSYKHPFYQYCLKDFLANIVLGMTSTTVWNGTIEKIPELTLIELNSKSRKYSLFDFNKYINYLYNNVAINISNSEENKYGRIYPKNNKTLIKLNFRIRFK